MACIDAEAARGRTRRRVRAASRAVVRASVTCVPLAYALAAGCTNDAAPTAAAGGGVRLAVSARVQGTASSVDVVVTYRRNAEGADAARELARRSTALAAGPTAIDFPVDLAPCLGDDARVASLGRGCDVDVALALTDAGVTLDRRSLSFPGVLPGTAIRPLGEVSLVAAGSVQFDQGAAVELLRDERQTLAVTVRDARGTRLTDRTTLGWRVIAGDRQDVLSVDGGTGEARALALGTTRVTAVDGRVADTVSVTVAAAPALGVDQAAVAFGAPRNGALPAAQSVTVVNTGGRTLTGLTATVDAYTAAPAGGAGLQWLPALVVQPAQVSASAPAALVLRPTRTDLPEGEYRARIRLAASGVAASPTGADTIQVRYVVTSAPAIAASPAALTFATTQGVDPAARTVVFSNGGTGTLGGIAVAGVRYVQGAAGWLPASSLAVAEPAPAGTGGAVAMLTVRPAVGTLAPGAYQAVVTVRASSGAPELDVPVSLTVAPPPTFALVVSGAGGGAGRVTVTPAGGAALACDVAAAQATGAGCAAAFVAGTAVDLLPQAQAGSTFLGWSGACSGTGACRVTMGAAPSAVTVRFSAAPSADRTWAGGTAAAPTTWSVATNWSPVGVPTPQDRVLIPADAWTQPVLDDAGGAGTEARVRSLDVRPQAMLTVATALRVAGDALVDGAMVGAGTLFLHGAESELRGLLPDVVIDGEGSVLLGGDTRVAGSVRVRDGARLSVGGHALAVAGALRLESGGTLLSSAAGDSVDVAGAVDVGPTAGISATAGVLRVGGALVVAGQGGLQSGGSHRVVLDGVAPQAVTVAGTGRGTMLGRLEVTNPTTLDLSTSEPMLVVGMLVVRNPANVTTRLLGAHGRLEVRTLDVQGVLFDRLRLAIVGDPTRPPPALSRAEFRGRPSVEAFPSWEFLLVNLRGGETAGSTYDLTFSQLTFEPVPPDTPATTTAYLRAVDANVTGSFGPSLVLRIGSPNVADGRANVIVGGDATVIWNGLGPE